MSRRTGLPRHVYQDKRRDGRLRLIFRPPGRKSVTLPGPPLSAEFWAAYAAALGQTPPPVDAGRRPRQGELGAAAGDWYRSAEFRQGDSLTQADKRGVLEAILREPLQADRPEGLTFMTCPLASLTARHVAVLRDRKAGAPHAANKRLRYLRQMFAWCVETGRMAANPALGVRRVTPPRGGHRTWTVDEVRAYMAAHPPGAMARLAIMILLYAGLRRSDAVTLGRQHIREGWIVKPQIKNRARWPRMIEIPILPPLAEEIARTARPGALALLTTEAGRPFTAKGFGARFEKWRSAAGLPAGLSAHGLRKAGATLAIDAGASEAQAMAIWGWEDADEIRTYAQARDRRRLAADGIKFLALPEQTRPENYTHSKPSVKQNRKSKQNQ
jgi:integrase